MQGKELTLSSSSLLFSHLSSLPPSLARVNGFKKNFEICQSLKLMMGKKILASKIKSPKMKYHRRRRGRPRTRAVVAEEVQENAVVEEVQENTVVEEVEENAVVEEVQEKAVEEEEQEKAVEEEEPEKAAEEDEQEKAVEEEEQEKAMVDEEVEGTTTVVEKKVKGRAGKKM